MKDLHNHIFSNTTCISKETMLRYINKQLPKEELYQVETHMLDCELCTDAYEGLAYAENASVLFAIDSQIDKRVRSGAAKAPIMRNLMVAASVLAIVFGTYFTFTFFNETVNKEQNLAINEIKKEESPFEGEEREITFGYFGEENEVSESEISEEVEKKSLEKEILSTPILVEQIALDEQEDEVSESAMVFEEVLVADVVEDDEEYFDVETTNSRNDNVLVETISANNYSEAEEPSFDKAEKVSAKKAKRSTANRKRDKSTTEKSAASAPVYADAVMLESTVKLNKSRQVTMTIEGFKVVNYLNEYQELYDAENDMTIELNSVPAGFSTKLDQEIAEKAKEEVKVEITYKETLESAMKLYKNKKYRAALSEFDNILAKHPKEVNAQFYAGLCYYHLTQNANALKNLNKVLKNKQQEFNEEANWYKALTLIKMKASTKAKKLLQEIVAKNGFYKIKAKEKLKGL